MNIRTDLAVEAHELSRKEAKEIEGVRLEKTEHGSICKTVVDVLNQIGAKAINKQCGRYITIDAPNLKYSLDDYEYVCKMIANELSDMCGTYRRALIVGLGNRDITPDALGTYTVNQLIVTGNLKRLIPETFDENYGDVCAVVPGVMGTTGLETTTIVKGICSQVKPDVIIAVDALAGADISRVCSTVQIADTGIAPGSGVGNNREGLNESTLGIKVIAIGVPTVIAAELIAEKELPEEYSSIMVTTKDIDLVIKKMSKTISNGINMALHKNLTFRDIEIMVG